MHNPLDPGYYESEELRGFGFRVVGENVRVSKLAQVHGPALIEIGDHVRIDAFASLIVATGWLKIGSYVHICTGCLIGARGGVEVADYSALSHGSKILSATDDFSGGYMTGPFVPPEFTSVTAEPVRIGRHVVIGADTLVLPGVTIGNGAAIGCKSVVMRDVPEWEIHLGMPARKHRARSRDLLALEARMVIAAKEDII